MAIVNWFSARSGACLSSYNAAARAACTSAENPKRECYNGKERKPRDMKKTSRLPGYPFRDTETSSISAIASCLSPTSYKANALPTLA